MYALYVMYSFFLIQMYLIYTCIWKKMYTHSIICLHSSDVADIDLWPGGMTEILLENSEVGPTFAEIFGRQFQSLLYGDRYFFTHRLKGRQLERGLSKAGKKTSLLIYCMYDPNRLP